MTCIKTGAKVHFKDYGSVVPADIYQVSGAIIVRVAPSAKVDCPNECPALLPTHILTAPVGGEEEFWRTDLNVFVVPSYCLKELK